MPETLDNIKALDELTDKDLHIGIVVNDRLVPVLKRQQMLKGKFLLEIIGYGGLDIRLTRNGDTQCTVLDEQTHALLVAGERARYNESE